MIITSAYKTFSTKAYPWKIDNPNVPFDGGTLEMQICRVDKKTYRVRAYQRNGSSYSASGSRLSERSEVVAAMHYDPNPTVTAE